MEIFKTTATNKGTVEGDDKATVTRERDRLLAYHSILLLSKKVS